MTDMKQKAMELAGEIYMAQQWTPSQYGPQNVINKLIQTALIEAYEAGKAARVTGDEGRMLPELPEGLK